MSRLPDASRDAWVESAYSERMLLCRPRGGFADMVSQIERCCRYAETTARTVVVDTMFGARGYGDEFDRYFMSRQAHLILSARGLHAYFDRVSTFPEFLQGRVSSYNAAFDHAEREYIEQETRLPLTFDFSRDYSHQLLVHQQHRRTPYAASVFMRLRLQPELTKELLARRAKIGGPYLGVHIRHTDYRSDYRPVIGRVAAAKLAKVFLATDNQHILDEFRKSLPDKQIFSFAEDLSIDGKPIHYRGLAGNPYKRNRDAIIDLLLLALSENIFWAEITNSPLGVTKSGFAVLATELADQKRYISELLGDAVKDGMPGRLFGHKARQSTRPHQLMPKARTPEA